MPVDKITMFKQASEFTSFHKKLGILIKPWLDKSWTVLDVGCGLALLDFEIADSVKSITALDQNEKLIDEINSKIDSDLTAGYETAGKIFTQCCDAKDIEGEWDVVLMSFYGAGFEELKKLMGFARHRVIIIVHGRAANGIFDPPTLKRKRRTAEELEEFLEKQGYRFRKTMAEMQFGQPFRSIDDIHSFLQNFKGIDAENILADSCLKNDDGEPEEEIEIPFRDEDNQFDLDRLVASTEERFVKTDRYDYPYYLPRNLSVGIFCVVK